MSDTLKLYYKNACQKESEKTTKLAISTNMNRKRLVLVCPVKASEQKNGLLFLSDFEQNLVMQGLAPGTSRLCENGVFLFEFP
ncbi:hypothetical protein J2Z23_003208 [Lederbergia galactosidilyticus]|uniref:Uncharacterized protein n=1 Tax=Lederbergia galactosidilytica TaxID=217031 RepID=A0A0Q9XUM9_9BACI|nr:hypothetical protein ACA29_12965 [Lederbergia galactosidilytica]MBP1916226.1 hypothetical protein [Lederbergia galactosidilytica]OAK75854.1 hypothetical protein ABB05_00245 [Lederbergia galactosidilytica]